MVVFKAACRMGLEDPVSKRRDCPYRARPIAALDQGQESYIAGSEPGNGFA